MSNLFFFNILVLYKQGPPFYHASYIVIIDILDGDALVTDQNKCMRKLTWNSLLGLERLSETAAKVIHNLLNNLLNNFFIIKYIYLY